MVTDCGYMATYGKRLDFFLKEVFNQHQRTNNRQLYGCYISLFVLKAKKSKVIIIDYMNTFKKSIDRKWKLSLVWTFQWQISFHWLVTLQSFDTWVFCGCQREGFLVEIDVTGRVESWVQEPPWFLDKEKDRLLSSISTSNLLHFTRIRTRRVGGARSKGMFTLFQVNLRRL